MRLTITHEYAKVDALSLVKRALAEAHGKLAGQAIIDKEEWRDNTLIFGFTVQGQSISGTLEVRDREFELVVNLPLMLRMFEGQIRKAIEERAAGVLK